ncbi:MAG: FAD:protein FMN transferase [Ghiorsea sp.]|nr:FAD:protein FMN transferase [Ghiorsea sp.]
MFRRFIFCLLALGLLSCQTQPKDVKASYFLLGTLVEFTIFTDDEARALEAITLAAKEIQRVQDTFTTLGDVENSVQQFNQAPLNTWVQLDEEVSILLLKAIDISKEVNGAFDPTLGQLNQLWAFSGEASPKVPPTQKAIQMALAQSGIVNIEHSEQGWLKKVEGLTLDFGAIAKGYAIDQGIQIFKQWGIQHAIINAGGDMRILGDHGGQAWRIAIRHPRHEQPLGWLEVTQDTSIVTSGDYERFYMFEGKRYHHILDPKTGMPSAKSQSVTVIASSAMLADAWSTGLFVLGGGEGLTAVQNTSHIQALWIMES